MSPTDEQVQRVDPVQGPRLLRPVDDGWVAGVCAGLAEHLGVRVAGVRLVMVLLAVLGSGLGVVVYLALWALTPQRLAPEGESRSPGARLVLPRSRLLHDEAVVEVVLGLALVLAGGAVILIRLGVDLRLGVTAPLALVAGGAIVVWTQLDRSERDRFLAG